RRRLCAPRPFFLPSPPLRGRGEEEGLASLRVPRGSRLVRMASCLITGATGFVGGHLAEACAARGLAVRTLARPDSDIALLERLGATVVRGDLRDDGSVREALGEAEVVCHCAAKVGDWGPVEDYRAVNVEG